MYQDIDKLEQIGLEMKKEKVMGLVQPSFKGGIIKGERAEKIIDEWLEGASFKDLKIPTKIIATDLVKGEEVILDKGKLSEAVIASISIPALFKPYIKNNMVLVDGGLTNPVPDDIVKEMGAQVIVSVNLDNYQSFDSFNEDDLGFSKISKRSMDIARQYLANYSTTHSDIVISPSFELRGMSNWKEYFTKNKGPFILKKGEREMGKNISKLKKLL